MPIYHGHTGIVKFSSLSACQASNSLAGVVSSVPFDCTGWSGRECWQAVHGGLDAEVVDGGPALGKGACSKL